MLPENVKKDLASNSNITAHDQSQIHIGTNQTAVTILNNTYNNCTIIEGQASSAVDPNLETQSLTKLAQYYKTFSKLKGVLEADRPYPLDSTFVDLAIISDKEQKENEQTLAKKEIWNEVSEDRLGLEKDIFSQAQKIIALKNIFSVTSYQPTTRFNIAINQPRTLLMTGRAGVGKTTLCNYIAYQFAMNALPFEKHFKGVIWIPLRQLSKNRYPECEHRTYELWEVLAKESNKSLTTDEAKALAQAIEKDPESFLFLLDGYDELLPEATQGPLVTVFEQLSAMPYCIITSRPRSTHRLRFDYHLEITGFSNDNILKYIRGFFNATQASTSQVVDPLIMYLQATPSLWGIMHVPYIVNNGM